ASAQPFGRSLRRSQSGQSLLKSVRCTQRQDQEQTTKAWLQTVSFFFAECGTDWRDVAKARLRQRCNPGKKESREHDDHKPGKASEHIDCTEPPPDSLHGSRSTSWLSLNLLTDCCLALRLTCSDPFADL